MRSATGAAIVITPLALAVACRGPTQITVTITTDVACSSAFGGSTITVGALGAIETQPPTSSKSACAAPGHVGTVVIQPSGAKDALVAMKIVMGVGHGPETCTEANGYTGGCIVARRALRFVANEDLHVVVGLDASCTDFPCGREETCVDHACKPATIDDSTRCESARGCGDEALRDGGATDGSSGGDASPTDGGGDVVIANDAGPPVAALVGAGDGHSCARTPAGGIKCWGDDTVGQRGDNQPNSGQDDPTARDVLVNAATPLTGALGLFVGRDTTCATMPGGVTKCWGIALDVPYDGGTPALYITASDWPALAGAVDVSVGYQFLCWRDGSSLVKCMGDNQLGQLQNGGKQAWSGAVSSLVPASVIGVASGQYFSCSLRSGGDLWCAGDNAQNECIPVGGSNTVDSPTAITALPALAEVRTGFDFTCARVAGDGTVLCWGDDQFSVVGYPSDAGRQDAPHTIKMKGGGSLTGIKALSLGDTFACAITSSNGVVCWGDNRSAQLGRGDPQVVGRESDVADVVKGVSNAIAIAAGVDHACAMDTNRQVFCWGRNQHGQCGLAPSSTPVFTAQRVTTF